MSDAQNLIAFQLLIAQKRGVETVGLRGTSTVVDEHDNPVIDLGDGLTHLDTRVKALSAAGAIGFRAAMAQAALLQSEGKLTLAGAASGFPFGDESILPDAKSLSIAAIEVWKARALAAVTAGLMGSGSSPSCAAAMGTVIERIAAELDRGGSLHRLEVVPGLKLEGVRDKWVDVQLSVLGSRFDAYRRPQEHQGLRPRKRLPVSLFMDGFASAAVIFGDPGAGKTTLLKWIASEVVRGRFHSFRLPIYLRLRDYAEDCCTAPATLFRFALTSHGVHDPGSDVEEFLERLGRQSRRRQAGYEGLLFLLDGWDEVPPDRQPAIAREIQRTLAIAPCLVTSRPGDIYGLPIIDHVRVEPLSPRLMHKLICSWLPSLRARHVMEHLYDHPELESLSQNPFILTALCGLANLEATGTTAALPVGRRGLYDGILDAVCEHFNGDNAPARLEEHLRICERLAYHIMTDAHGAPRLDFGAADVEAVGGSTEVFSKTILRSRLVVPTAISPPTFAFLHATLHEFLVARHLNESSDHDRLAELTRAYLHSPRWAGVFQSLADQLLDTREAVRRVFLGVLREALAQRDRFAVTECCVANYLADLRCHDGGVLLVGEDVATQLWRSVQRWPEFTEAVAALARLAPSTLAREALALRERNAGEKDEAKRRQQGRLLAAVADQLYRWRPSIGEPLDRLGQSPPLENAELGFARVIPKLARRVLDVNDSVAWADLCVGLSTLPEHEQVTRVVLLGECGDENAAVGLERFFWRTNSLSARLAVVSALGRIGCQEARDALLSIVAACVDRIPEGDLALKSLAAYPCPSGVELLLDIANDSAAKLDNRVMAAAALGATADSDVVDFVAALASSEQHPLEVRLTCVDALADRGNPSHLAALVASAKKREFGDQTSRVLAAIVGIGSRSANGTLFRSVHDDLAEIAMGFLRDKDPTNRAYSIKAAGFTGERFVDGLAAIARDGSASSDDRIAAALALADTRSLRGVDALLDLVQDARKRIQRGDEGDFGHAGTSALLTLVPKRLPEYDYPEFELTLARWAQANSALVYEDRVVTASEPRVRPASARQPVDVSHHVGATDLTANHSDDFTSVNWFGRHYTFVKGNQAESVRVLWEAWQHGSHSLNQQTIGEKIGSHAERFELRKVFRRKVKGHFQTHPAWGAMIQEATKGSYRLAPPNRT